MSMRRTSTIALTIADEEDLKVASSLLQDATVRVDDLAFLPKERRFALVANRYRWEGKARSPKGERVRTGLHFDDVMKARRSNVPLEAAGREDAVLDLLTISWDAGEDGTGAVTLVFAGGATIKLDVECLNAALNDIGNPWKAAARPGHELD